MTVLTLALEKVDILPPDRVTDNTSVLTLKNLVFEPLLGWENGFPRPALLSHWTQCADGRCWEFFIRDGAVFHDGKACEPADILAVIDGLLRSVDTFGMKWSYARYLADVRIGAGSDRSIIVQSPEPFADLLDIFSEFYISRLASDGRAILGTGPYKVVEFAPLQHAVLERLTGTGPQRIRLQSVASAEERWQMLQGGSTDAAIHIDHMEHPPLQDDRFEWGLRLSPLSVMYYLNCHRGIFASRDMRLAANLAINKVELVESVFHGLAEPSSTIVSRSHLGMASAGLDPIPYDPDRARALLDRWPGSRTIVMRTPTFMPERAPEISQFVAQQLRSVGFDVSVETETARPEYARQVGRKEIGDLALFDSSPHSTFRILNDKISSATRAVWWQGYDNADVERLILAANRATAPADREAAYAACLRELNADPAWIYLVNPVNVFAARPGVARIALTAKGTLQVG